MRHVCRLALFLCLLPACSFVAVAQSWQAPTLYPAGNDAPSRIATADLLGTQSSDVEAVTTSHDLVLYANDGAGRLSSFPQTLRENVTAIAAAKFSGTTMDDLVVISSTTPTAPLQLMLLPSQGGRVFGTAVAIAPQLALGATCQLNAADFNGDGVPDVLIFCAGSNSLVIGINNGKSGFTYTSVPGFLESGRQIQNVSAGDLDGDGLADIVVQSSPIYSPTDSRIDVLWNSAAGTFSPQLNYISQPDITALYVANADGHPSANLVTDSSNSVYVFADQANRNALTQSMALQIPSGCSVTSLSSGRIVNIKYSLGQDMIAAATCNGQNHLLVFPNSAQTSLTLTPTLSDNSGVPTLSMAISVASASGTVIPTGNAAVKIGTATLQEPLVSGAAQINPQSSPGTSMLQVSYSGDSNNAGASETVAIVLADSTAPAGSTSSFLINGPTITPTSNLLVGTPYTVAAAIQQKSSGASNVLTAPSGTITFSDNGAAIAAAQGVPSESLSAWSSSDCSFNGSTWAGTQCAMDGSGSYQIAYEQDQNVYSSQAIFTSAGLHSLAASYPEGASGLVTKTLQVDVAASVRHFSGELVSTQTAISSQSLSPMMGSMRLTPMAQSTTTSFTVASNNNPSLYGQSVTFTTSYPASGNGTWNYYDNGQLLGPATVQLMSSPEGIAVNSSSNYVYVSNYGNNTVSVINGANDHIVATIAVGANPEAIAVDSSSGYIYVANYQGSSISVINSSSNSVVASIPVGAYPDQIVVNPNTHTVYEADSINTKIISGSTFTVTDTVSGGCASIYCNLGINPSTNTLFVSSGQEIATVNLATNTPSTALYDSTLTDANMALSVNTGNNTAYIYEGGTPNAVIGSFNGTTQTVGTSMPLAVSAAYPAGIAVNSTTGFYYYLWAAGSAVGDNQNGAFIDVGTTPSGIAVNPTTNLVYVANQGSNTVSVINGATDAVIDTIGMTATYTTSSLTTGTHPITSSYSGDYSGNPAAISAVFDQVVNGVTPTLSVSCSPNPITYGSQNTNCSTSLTGGSSPTGTETWTINGGAWTTTGVDGSAGGFAGYSAGTYTIAVVYSGDDDNNSVSSSTTLTISKATPSISVSCSPNPITYGSQNTTCTASVSGGATGTVTFTANGGGWTTVSLSGGTASATGFSDWNVGTYPVRAAYSGDSNFNAVSSSTSIAIQKAASSISFATSATTAIVGQSIGVSASVCCSQNGTVQFYDSTWNYANVATFGSGASSTFSASTPGTYQLYASWPGDTNYNAATSAPINVTFVMANSSVSLACTPNPADLGQAVSCTATVSGGANGESVDFLDGATQIGAGTISSGVATFSTTSLAVGTYSLTAEYVGDGTYNPSTSNAVSESINNPGTVTDISSNLNPSTYGQNVAFWAMVNTGGTIPTGTVTFENGGASIGSGTVSAVGTTNELRYSTDFGAWATNDSVTITPAATTAPDGSETASLLTVGSNGGYYILDSFPCSPGVTTYSVWLKQSANPSGQTTLSVRFNDGSGVNLLTVFPRVVQTSSWSRFSTTNTAPAGTASCTMGIEQDTSGGGGSALPGQSVYAWGAQVEVASQPGPYIATNGSAASGSGGLATFTTSSLPVGSLNITTAYSGDANNLTSTSPTLWQNVNKATPSISASCSPNPVAYLSYYSCIADVSGSATATVTWPAIFGGATTSLSGGATSTPTYQATATPAAYSGTVTYNGDGNYNSISTSVSITSIAISQTIAFTPPPSPVAYGVAPIALSATATSGLPVAFSVLSGPGTVSGNTLTVTGPGTVVVAANQGGNGYYLPTAQVTQSVVVSQTPTVATLSSSLDPSTYGQNVTFSALVNTGGTIPTGTVTFENGGASIGSASVSTVSATNLIPASTWGLSGGNWNVWDYPSTTHTVANATAPDGSNTALAVTVAGSDHTVVQQSPAQYLAPYFSVYGHTYTFSIWARTPNSCSSFGIGMENDTAWEGGSRTVSDGSAWQRFSVTYTFTQPSDSSEVDSYVAVPAGCTVQLWGWQFEEASQPGPYIATNGSAASGSGGITTLTTSSLPAGSDPITAVYGGDSNDAASTSPVLTQTVTAAAPTLTVATSGSPSISGTSVTFTATISSGPTGTITFYDSGTAIGTGTISGTTATFTTSSLAVGSHSITAGWTGNADYSAVTSSAISQVVNPISQTISFTPPPSPVTYGVAPIALSATATSGLPVSFSVLSGPGTVSGSILTITGAGTVVVAANQGGNADYSAAPQVTQSVVVNKATPTISWTTPAAITYGTALGGTQLNATSGGVAGTFVYSPASGTVLGAGPQTLSVTFTPTDSTDYNSASDTTSLTVNKATGVFTITSSANPSVYGAAVSITLSGPAAATGTITLLDGANPIGTGTLSNGVATINVPLFLAGSHSLTASYPGDANFLPSTSAPYTQVVNTAAVVISIASTVNPSIYGETVTFTFTFKGVTRGAVPTGSAVVTDGVNNLGALTLNSSGVATFTTSALVAGTHSITAAYQGDSNYH